MRLNVLLERKILEEDARGVPDPHWREVIQFLYNKWLEKPEQVNAKKRIT